MLRLKCETRRLCKIVWKNCACFFSREYRSFNVKRRNIIVKFSWLWLLRFKLNCTVHFSCLWIFLITSHIHAAMSGTVLVNHWLAFAVFHEKRVEPGGEMNFYHESSIVSFVCLDGRHTFRTGECCLKEKGSDLLAKLWQLTNRNSIHSSPLSFYGVLRKRLGSVITTCKVIRLQLTR